MRSGVTIRLSKEATEMSNCPICYKMVCVGDIRTMTRSGKEIHASCYDRIIKVLGFSRHNIDCNAGWKHKNYWALNWVEYETPPKKGEEIKNTYGECFKVVFSRGSFVVLRELKKPK